MKHIKYIAYISLFLLASCSTTKNLPEGEVLYMGIKKIEVTNEDKSKEGEEALTEVEAALAYTPNNALLGSSSVRIPFPFGRTFNECGATGLNTKFLLCGMIIGPFTLIE